MFNFVDALVNCCFEVAHTCARAEKSGLYLVETATVPQKPQAKYNYCRSTLLIGGAVCLSGSKMGQVVQQL
jgi:hypothetical protein